MLCIFKVMLNDTKKGEFVSMNRKQYILMFQTIKNCCETWSLQRYILHYINTFYGPHEEPTAYKSN